MHTRRPIDFSSLSEATVEVQHHPVEGDSFPEIASILTQAQGETRIERLPQFFEQTCDQQPDGIAVICGQSRLTYRELDHRANRLARLLIKDGVEAGNAVGILLERSLDTYVALLGVLKAGAAFVPLDPSFPPERVAFIAEDAGLRELVTTSALREKTRALPCLVLEVDVAAAELAHQSESRPEISVDPSSLCYIIYTSGSSGRPKGVAVSHASITNFLSVVRPIYDVRSDDHVYQGMTIAFDFSFEEIWPTWIAGATLVGGPTDSRRLGHGLSEFLIEHNITVLCCVPTLLATIDQDVPSLRSLLVGGEACPADLVRRWSRPGRRILNTYGPTEATVTAIWCELFPDRLVTIGTPLPTYRAYILDDQLRPVEEGESGEICIGGPGVAIGYLNRPDLTMDRFVPNPVTSDRGDAPRLYRTGDLGRFTSSGEIEYLGRIDTQVKIRGYRIEVGEIEQVLREDQAVENAIVTPLEVEGIVQDLVAYITLHGRNSEAELLNLRERLHVSLLERLPAYMIPAFIEVLDNFPMLAADKVNRAALSPPASQRLGIKSTTHVSPATPLEDQFATAWGQVLGRESVSVEDDFFCDLGGHSLAAARLISRLRQQLELQSLAIGDLYDHPTIRSLAQYIEDNRSKSSQTSDEQPTLSSKPLTRQHSTVRVLSCGIAQLALNYGVMLVLSIPVLGLFYWVMLLLHIFMAGLPEAIRELPPSSLIELLVGTVVAWFGVTTFLLPVIGGRLLMRGVRPGWYPLWGITYLRWWLYSKILTLSPLGAPSPLGLFVGSPLLPPYLRLLGAKVGRNCQLASASIGLPMFIDIDEDVSIGHAVELQPYIVEGGWLRLAPIRIGRGSFLGTNSVVLAGAQIGSEATVAEQSLVHADLVIPAGEHWGGSPIKCRKAAPALLATMAAKADGGRWPIWMLIGFSMGTLVLMLVPWLMMIPSTVFVGSITIHNGLGWGIASTVLAGPIFVLSTCTLILVGKKAVLPVVHPGLYSLCSGFWLRKWFSDQLMSMSLGMTNQLYATLYVVPFLRLLGARIGRWSEVSTVGIIDPDMLILGDESFVADIAVLGAAVFYRGCVALAPAEVGRRSFVGNGALVPGSCRLGDNSLLGVHSVPPAQQVDAGTSWLGSPAIFLPRRQASQHFEDNLTYLPRPSLVAWRLVIEYLRITLPPCLLALALLIGVYSMYLLAQVLSPLELLVLMPALAMGMGMATTLVVVLLKWLIVGRYRERVEPLWSLFVRRSELITGLYESLAVLVLIGGLAGTPWIAPLLRLFGARIGQRVWLATTYLTEFDLVDVGDDAAVGETTALQTHLFEDRVMKMSTVKIRANSSIGSRSVVLYDTEVGEGTSLDALSLVMKGETLPARSHWRGIPARASSGVPTFSLPDFPFKQ